VISRSEVRSSRWLSKSPKCAVLPWPIVFAFLLCYRLEHSRIDGRNDEEIRLFVLLDFSLPFRLDLLRKSNFTFSVTFGQHPIGFRIVHQYDYSRVYKPAFDWRESATGERARPIQTLIWYPRCRILQLADAYGRYLELFATEENFDAIALKGCRNKAAIAFYGVGEKFEIERVQRLRLLGSQASPDNFLSLYPRRALAARV